MLEWYMIINCIANNWTKHNKVAFSTADWQRRTAKPSGDKRDKESAAIRMLPVAIYNTNIRLLSIKLRLQSAKN